MCHDSPCVDACETFSALARANNWASCQCEPVAISPVNLEPHLIVENVLSDAGKYDDQIVSTDTINIIGLAISPNLRLAVVRFDSHAFGPAVHRYPDIRVDEPHTVTQCAAVGP